MDSYQLNLMVPRGMLYLYDWSNDDVEIPEYDDTATVGATSTALSIALISDQDGAANVKISKLGADPDYSSRFGTFSLSCPNRILCLCVMGDEEVHRISLNCAQIEVRVSGKSDKFPSEISIASKSFQSVV